MHEMYCCQPAICALAVANMSRPVKVQWFAFYRHARMEVERVQADTDYYSHS